MIERAFIVKDTQAAVRKTLLWSLVIAFVSVIATQFMYDWFLPGVADEYGARLRILSFAMTMAISIPFVGLFSFIALRMNAFNAQLREMARRDGLTGLLNRTALEEIIAERNRESREDTDDTDALIIIDIDHFKKVNDTHGHSAGDHVLRMVSVCIAGNVFERDHVARIGGEEFAAYLINAGAEGAIQCAERIRSALEECKTHYEGQIIRVTASIGGALYPQGASYQGIYQGADFALYRAKRAGRNLCEFNGLPAIWHTREREPGEIGDSDAA